MERKWRLVATAVAVVVFAGGAPLLTPTLGLAIAVFVWQPDRRRRPARPCLRPAFCALPSFFQLPRVVKIDGDADTLAVLAGEHGSVVVANHPSFIDVLVLLAHVEQANCVVKTALWRNPLLTWAVRLAGYIPGGDPARLLSACEAALRR